METTQPAGQVSGTISGAVDARHPLVDVAWLAAHLDDPDVVVLDASIPPHETGDERIPGALRFDLEGEFSVADSPLPHTMPSAEAFQAAARRLGIGSGSTIVTYDAGQLYAAARPWWMFHAMGHDAVAVLDGGLAAWRAAGHPVEAGTPPTSAEREGDFVAKPVDGAIVDADAVAAALESGDAAVVDARSHGRFTGEAAEPRPGLRGGHMPGATNLPFADVQSDGRLLPADRLHPLVAAALGEHDRAVFSCGSGVTACVDALAAVVAGRDPATLAVYDGSWTQWGDPAYGRPVVTGEA